MDTKPLAETPDSTGAYPRLTEAQIELLAQRGKRRRTEAGQVLFAEGDHTEEFIVVLHGKVVVTADERQVAVHGRGRFLGELGLLEGQVAFLTAVVAERGEVLAVPVRALRAVVERDAALGDLILRAYLIRRSMLIGRGAGFRIIGSCFSPDTRRLREFAARNRLPHRWIDLEKDSRAAELLRQLGVSPEDTPVVIWHGRQVLHNPSNAELAKVIGLPVPRTGKANCELLIVGAGPAGLAAAVYGASDGLSTIAIDAVAIGGQAATTSKIENYLGFPTGVSGGELAERAALQADKFGARTSISADACALAPRQGAYLVQLRDGSTLTAPAIVIATGARYRRLNVPRLEEFESTSVYYAATQIEANLCGPDPVAIVGGGNSAGQAAVFLADQVAKVYLVIRDGDLGKSMSRYLVDRVQRHPNIEVLRHTEVKELVGDLKLESVVVVDNETGDRTTLDVRALFVFIGARPGTSWLSGTVALDSHGFVLTGAEAPRTPGATRRPVMLETTWPGVFAVGDVRSGSVKRVASAVGEGAMAVRMVHEYLSQGTSVR